MVQEVGAAYVNASGTVNLISHDGSRWVTWDPQTGAFGTAADVQTLEGTGLPLTSVSAAGATRDRNDTYMFGSDGRDFTVFERGQDEYDDVGVFGVGDFTGATLSGVGAIALAANSNRLFFFDRSGTRMQLWSYGTETWTSEEGFVDNFGGGGAPIPNVGAAVYTNGAYYLFDTAGKTWATYLGNFVFEGPFDISELGSGTLNFR